MALVIDGFEIDAEVTSDPAFDSAVTEHPVEDGANLTDHVRALPIVLSIEGVVTNTPIGTIAERRGDVDSDGTLVHLPADDALAWMLAIRDRREPVTVLTSLRSYDNMVMQSFSAPRNASTGDALRFKATFKQIVLATNERTTVLVPERPKKANKGQKPSTPKPAATVIPKAPPEKYESWLNKGVNSIIGG